MIGLKNPRHILNQSDAKPKPITTWSHAFSRAWRWSRVFAMSSHWFIALFTFVVIGHCNLLTMVLRHSIENRSMWWTRLYNPRLADTQLLRTPAILRTKSSPTPTIADSRYYGLQTTAPVIWLCACVRKWPYRGVGVVVCYLQFIVSKLGPEGVRCNESWLFHSTIFPSRLFRFSLNQSGKQVPVDDEIPLPRRDWARGVRPRSC